MMKQILTTLTMKKLSNLYACQLGLGGSYGHTFKNIKLPENLHHDDCVVKDGDHSGSGADICRQCMTGSDNMMEFLCQ